MPSVLLLLVGGGALLYSLWQLRRWLAEAERQTAAGPRRLEVIVEELITTAEGASAVVAEKTEVLEDAIARANATLAKLEATLAGGAAPDGAALAKRVVTAKLRRGAAVAAPLAEPGIADAVQASPVAVTAPDIPELHRRVHALADAGQDVTTIARQLSLTKGEVQFILGLRRLG